jgi:methionyl aminopeptidase
MAKNIPYSEDEVMILKEGGKRLREILEYLGKECKVGVTGKYIDELAEKKVLENGDIPVFKNYKPHGAQVPFPATICISANDVVAHGIPNDIPFKLGDVVSLDLGFRHDGLVVDSAITIIVGEENNNFPKERKLLDVTKKALEIGIQTCQVGKRVNDVGIEIEKYVVSQGFNVVDVLCGHAVGEWASVFNKLSGQAWFYFGHQGYEYVDLGRIWQIGLFVGLLLWLFLVGRS